MAKTKHRSYHVDRNSSYDEDEQKGRARMYRAERHNIFTPTVYDELVDDLEPEWQAEVEYLLKK